MVSPEATLACASTPAPQPTRGRGLTSDLQVGEALHRDGDPAGAMGRWDKWGLLLPIPSSTCPGLGQEGWRTVPKQVRHPRGTTRTRLGMGEEQDGAPLCRHLLSSPSSSLR